MFTRPVNTSTLLSLAANIGVPAARWKGTPKPHAADVLAALATAGASAQQAIGVVGLAVWDANRAKVRALAYQAPEQLHAYWPDSGHAAFDKRSLRDGHYTAWSPTVYLTAVDTNGVPVSPRAKYFIELVLGQPTTPAFESDGLESVIASGLVPDCAMRVTRASEGGDLSLYAPPSPCGCYFESKVPMGGAPPGCMTCTDSSTCGGGSCNHGFCEARP